MTKYYYELRDSNGKINWISSLDLNNKTVVRITPENTCGAKPLPSKNDNSTPNEFVDNYNNPNADYVYVPETPKTPFRDNSEKIESESLTADTVCKSAWYYNEYNLWFIETKIGNYIRVQFTKNSKIVLVKTTATLKDLDLLSKKRANHAYYCTTIAGIFGNNFTVIG